MPENQLIPQLRFTMEHFDPAPSSPYFPEMTFCVPVQEERMAVGMVIYVSGLHQFYHPRYVALALVPGWLCLCNEEGVLWSHSLQGIRRVDFGSVPHFGLRRQAPDGRMLYDTIPEATAIALEIERRVFTDKVMLVTLLPEQAHDWVQLITVARQAWIDGALEGGDIRH